MMIDDDAMTARRKSSVDPFGQIEKTTDMVDLPHTACRLRGDGVDVALASPVSGVEPC